MTIGSVSVLENVFVFQTRLSLFFFLCFRGIDVVLNKALDGVGILSYKCFLKTERVQQNTASQNTTSIVIHYIFFLFVDTILFSGQKRMVIVKFKSLESQFRDFCYKSNWQW